MKKAALILLLSSMTGGVAMATEKYIPWTFDDFDSDCNVINDQTEQKLTQQDLKTGS